ncbi:MAG: hypothetical protein QM652_00695 [Legionella sp.]|uniref:hypothetical protein n=1 Tax=Legionella sp. TaxID=459 RepID=UPI0039E32313
MTQLDSEHVVLKDKPTNQFHNKITLFAINEPRIRKSHILNVLGFFQKMISFLFNIYPNDIFSFKEASCLNNKVNETLLKNKLDALPDNFYINFSVFEKKRFSFSGHSMIIKKTGDSFSFFDPNYGEYRKLNFRELCDKINAAMKEYKGTAMVFLNAKNFIKELEVSQKAEDKKISKHQP